MDRLDKIAELVLDELSLENRYYGEDLLFEIKLLQAGFTDYTGHTRELLNKLTEKGITSPKDIAKIMEWFGYTRTDEVEQERCTIDFTKAIIAIQKMYYDDETKMSAERFEMLTQTLAKEYANYRSGAQRLEKRNEELRDENADLKSKLYKEKSKTIFDRIFKK